MSRALQLAPTGIPAMRPKRRLAVTDESLLEEFSTDTGYPWGVNGT
jgi:hypothetical protein